MKAIKPRNILCHSYLLPKSKRVQQKSRHTLQPINETHRSSKNTKGMKFISNNLRNSEDPVNETIFLNETSGILNNSNYLSTLNETVLCKDQFGFNSPSKKHYKNIVSTVKDRTETQNIMVQHKIRFMLLQKEEVSFFEKLNHPIAKFASKNLFVKCAQYLKRLQQIITCFKVKLFKHYAQIIKQVPANKIESRFRHYFETIEQCLDMIDFNLREVLGHNQKGVQSGSERKLKGKASAFDFEKNSQNFLGRLNSFEELSKTYRNSNAAENVVEYRRGIFEQIINAIIRARHSIGYFTNQLTTLCTSASGNREGQSEVWKAIYDKKYFPKSVKKRSE